MRSSQQVLPFVQQNVDFWNLHKKWYYRDQIKFLSNFAVIEERVRGTIENQDPSAVFESFSLKVKASLWFCIIVKFDEFHILASKTMNGSAMVPLPSGFHVVRSMICLWCPGAGHRTVSDAGTPLDPRPNTMRSSVFPYLSGAWPYVLISRNWCCIFSASRIMVAPIP